MRPTDLTTQKLLSIAEPICNGAGYELVDLSLTQSREGWVLQVIIDHLSSEMATPSETSLRVASTPSAEQASLADPGSAIGFEDCEYVSRELSAALDVEDPIAHNYRLEVSSPGVDRPLKKVIHFQRFLGHTAKVRLGAGISGRRNFTGVIRAVETVPEQESQPTHTSCTVVSLEVDGQTYQLPFDDIERARLVPDWNALFHRMGGARGAS